MEIINVNSENIDREHICCAISDKKNECCVSSKKVWLKERFNEGIVFKKLDVRGKVFIEYIPAERAWCPVDAEGYMFINCFWVSGQFKGQGFANKLLDECILDSKTKGKKGLVVISSKNKMPFLSDPKYLKYKGFKICDTASMYFELLYLPFDKSEKTPQFKECCKKGEISEMGIVLYYSNQCPHTAKYVPIIEAFCKQKGLNFIIYKYEATEQAQKAPVPATTYSLFIDGKFVTNEVLSESRFIKILHEKGIL